MGGGFFFGLLGFVDDLLLDVARYGVVVREFHGVAALAAGDAGQRRAVTGHFRQHQWKPVGGGSSF